MVPYLTLPDPAAAMHFYQDAFGFESKYALTDDHGKVQHAEMTWWGDGRLMLGPESEEHTSRAPTTTGTPSPVGLYVYTDDVAALFKKAMENGAFEIQDPQVTFWGDRVAILADPWGYKWTFAQNVADFDPNVFAR